MRESRKMYLFLFALTVATFAGFQGWRTLLNNFAVERAGISGLEMGVIQSVREVPGFLALLVVYLLLIVREHRLAALSVLLLGLGVGLTGLFPSYGGLMLTTLLMSFGFHYFETCNQSLTLQYFDKGTAPLVFGRLRAVGSATNIAVGGLVWLASTHLEYVSMYAVLGGFAVVVALGCLLADPTRVDLPAQSKKMVLKRTYWLFYVLTFLGGARRQIFVAFAVYLLVSKFEFSIQEVAALFIVNNVIGWFANPYIGKAVNRFGERKVLSLEYVSLLAVFVVYAFSESKWLVASMYVVDHLVFNFAMAIRTFFQKIAAPEDIAPSMAVGFTINHIAAVAIPALGGIVWATVSPAAVFTAGVGLAVASLVFVQLIDREVRLKGEE
ncbi:MFS transporter [Desulfohalovibrio reitneri]|uniref:MFS transporter n=1 Tax=Desulfohalovibrio reitneri TaxID=1307759 RepID=UPI0004A76627|nr:MFS transporter [Desulfohalovibrio reitneri]